MLNRKYKKVLKLLDKQIEEAKTEYIKCRAKFMTDAMKLDDPYCIWFETDLNNIQENKTILDTLEALKENIIEKIGEP